MARRTLSGLSPRQEQAYQERQLGIAARRMETAVAREVARGMREYGAAYGNPGRQSEAVASHRQRMERILTREYEKMFASFGFRLLDAATKAHPLCIEIKNENLFTRFARDWIARTAAFKVTAIANTTQKQAESIIKRVLQAGLAEGVANIGDGIMAAIRSEGGELARWRGRLIARTETHTAANSAAQEAAKATGLPGVRKEWVAAIDGRERPEHAEADGQTQALDDPFIVDGEELMYPGDMSGSAANVVNCRCAVAHVVED